MTAKSRRHPLRYDKDQAGCIWGFISFFDFRHGRLSHRRLLSDKSRFTRQVVGVGCSNLNQQILTGLNEDHQETNDGEENDAMTADTTRTSVKELMEVEMSTEKGCGDHTPDNDTRPRDPELDHKERIKRKQRRKRKISKGLGDRQSEVNASQNLSAARSFSQHESGIKLSSKLDLEIVANDIYQQIYQKSKITKEDDSNYEIDSRVEQKNPVIEKKLSEAIRILVDWRSKGGKIDQSKEFMDALETLSLNKELIFELLEDPNSVLVKVIEDLEDFHLEEDRNGNTFDKLKFLDRELENSKKRHNFFRKSCKSEEKIRFSGDENCQAPNRIVILKPRLPSGSPDFLGNGMRKERSGSQFSFSEIKRKLKNAMSKEKNRVPSNGITYKIRYERENSGNSDRGIGGEKGVWNSPNRDHFYIEKFARPSNGMRNKDERFKWKSNKTILENGFVHNNEKGISNIYIEAKRHLSEMLSQGDDIGDLSTKQSPKALGNMLSVPGFNFSSPINSPRENGHHLVTAKQSLTPHDSVEMPSENISELKPENDLELWDKNSDILVELNHGNANGVAACSVGLEKNSEDDVGSISKTDAMCEMAIFQTAEALHEDGGEVLDVSAIEDNQAGDLVEAFSEEEKLEHLLSSPCQSPPSLSIAKDIGDLDTGNGRLERPSPISVLEPLFMEDDISPASIRFQPAEPPMQPLHLQFEEQLVSARDQELHVSTRLDDEESAFEYVEAVLLASDLNLNEFRIRWLSSSPILDPSLFDEVELFSSRSSLDQKLLFDCTNEVLNEVCDVYFGCFPHVSFVKHNTRTIPRGMELIHEIWNGVEWHLRELSPHSLDQAIRKDIYRDGKWMDLRLDVVGVGYEIGEFIFAELVEDVVLSFPKEDPKLGSSMLLGE